MPTQNGVLYHIILNFANFNKILKGGNIVNLAQWFEEHSQVFDEWDKEANKHIDLENVGYSSKRKAWWICNEGHRWETMIFSRTILGHNCPYCENKKVIAGYNDLASTDSDVLSRWNYEKNTDISPTEITKSSHKLVWWKCEQGHSWQQRVDVITSDTTIKSGCPYCYGKKVEKGFNDLLFLEPKVAKEWCYELNGYGPDEITAGSKKMVWWKCELGHTWKTPPYSRTGKGKTGCPYCKGFKAWEGFNDLKTINSRLAMEWSDELNGDLKPTQVTRGSHKKVWWECSEGHVWQAFVYARAKENGTGCPVCAGVAKDKRPDF